MVVCFWYQVSCSPGWLYVAKDGLESRRSRLHLPNAWVPGTHQFTGPEEGCHWNTRCSAAARVYQAGQGDGTSWGLLPPSESWNTGSWEQGPTSLEGHLRSLVTEQVQTFTHPEKSCSAEQQAGPHPGGWRSCQPGDGLSVQERPRCVRRWLPRVGLRLERQRGEGGALQSEGAAGAMASAEAPLRKAGLPTAGWRPQSGKREMACRPRTEGALRSRRWAGQARVCPSEKCLGLNDRKRM